VFIHRTRITCLITCNYGNLTWRDPWPVSIRSVIRTVGLSFAVLCENPYELEQEGEWIAVSLYGTIGATVKGSKHETIGLEIH